MSLLLRFMRFWGVFMGWGLTNWDSYGMLALLTRLEGVYKTLKRTLLTRPRHLYKTLNTRLEGVYKI